MNAGVAQLVERVLAKDEVAGSNPVSRSIYYPVSGRCGRVVRQRSAKPSTRVRIPATPPILKLIVMSQALRTIQIISSLVLVLVVLLQQRGASLSGAFGGTSTAFRSRRGIEKFLYNATIVIAVIFALISLAVVFWAK